MIQKGKKLSYATAAPKYERVSASFGWQNGGVHRDQTDGKPNRGLSWSTTIMHVKSIIWSLRPTSWE
jgi:hypothetical protein